MQPSTRRFLLTLAAVVVGASAGGASLVVAAVGLRPHEAMQPVVATLCERYNGLPPHDVTHAGMAHVPGGRFTIGSDRHYAEEAPTAAVVVEPFWIDRHDVTNAQFARFVAATGHVTVAERAAASADGQQHVAASAVFVTPVGGKAGAWRLAARARCRLASPAGPWQQHRWHG